VLELPAGSLLSKSLFIAVFSGLLVSLATGLAENSSGASIIGYRYYGYPLVWRVTKTLQPAEYLLANLAIDAAFWTLVLFVALISLRRVALLGLKTDFERKAILLSIILFLPAGLVMDLAHESGHAVLGIDMGGRLTYVQIGYFEIYPKLAIAPVFYLGRTVVTGLNSAFASGLFLLGGSVTTNTTAWALGLILLGVGSSKTTKLALKILGSLVS
jgi:hypothetical protein